MIGNTDKLNYYLEYLLIIKKKMLSLMNWINKNIFLNLLFNNSDSSGEILSVFRKSFIKLN